MATLLETLLETLEQVCPSLGSLDRRRVASQMQQMLQMATLGFAIETECHWLSSLCKVRLQKGDPLVTCRTDAVIWALQQAPPPLNLKKRDEVRRQLQEFLSEMVDISVLPTVLDDEIINSQDFSVVSPTSSVLSSSAPLMYDGTLLAIETKQDGKHNGFIYINSTSQESSRGTLTCNLEEEYRVADSSLAFPLHPGDQIQFKLGTSKQEKDVDVCYDILVTNYMSLNDKEISEYIGMLEKCSDSTESLLMITNFPPMWKYVMNADQLPVDVPQKIVSLHKSIVSSRKCQLQKFRIEKLMHSYIGAKFLDILYDEIEKGTVGLDNIRDFVLSFVKYLPTSAFAVVQLISRLTRLFNRDDRMDKSCDFLMEVVTATCVPSSTVSVSTLRWDQMPLIITPRELKILTQDGKHADLPSVQTKGPYKNLTSYYNTYFRLLREDCFYEACRMIRAAKLGQLERDSDVVYHVSGFTGLHFLRNGRGMAYGIKIKASMKVDWATSDALKSENLVCISIDGKFEDEKMIWATIATQRGSKTDKLHKDELFVQFCTEANERTDAEIILLLRDSKFAVMIESPTFFRAYYPVLQSLQQRNIEEMPFQNELLRFESSAGGCIQDSTLLDWKVIFTQKDSSGEMPYKTFGELDAIVKDPNFECSLDASQLDALKLACTQRLTIIQGPPGTGKSYIGAKLVHLLRTMDTLPPGPILILAYKNRVLDQFLVDCLQFCSPNEIVRVGRVGHRQLESRSLTAILHREELKRRPRARRIHYDSISRLKILKEKLSRAGRQLALSDDCLNADIIVSQATEEQLQSLVLNDKDSTEEDSRILDRLKIKGKLNLQSLRHKKEFEQLVMRSATRWLGDALEPQEQSKPEQKAQMSFFFRAKSEVSSDGQSEGAHCELIQVKTVENERLWSAYDDDDNLNVYGVEKVDEGPESISFTDKLSQERQFKILMQESTTRVQFQVANCSDVWALDSDKRSLLAQLWLRRQSKAAVKLFTSAAIEYNTICDDIQDRNIAVSFDILKSAHIVGMTTTGAAIHQQLLTAIEPSVVIVEEACEVLEAQLLATLTSSVKHLIMIGDHVQLRPKVACHWLEYHSFHYSMFERLVLNAFPHKTLQNQRRMREEFTELLMPYYPDLRSHPQVKGIKIPECLGSPAQHMLFWSYAKEWETREASGKIVNDREVRMVATLVLALLICDEKAESITVLSPYRAQVNAVIVRLQKKNCKDLCCDEDIIRKAANVQVCTVDEYQGYESDIIILSLVRSNRANKLGFVKEKNRLVVSISRQRSSLILIGNSDFLQRNDTNWKAIIEKLKKCQCHTTQLTLKMKDSQCAVDVDEVLKRANERFTKTTPTGAISSKASSELRLKVKPSNDVSVEEATASTTTSDSKLSITLERCLPSASDSGSQEELESSLFPTRTLQRVAHRVSSNWKPLCRELGIEENDIETIERNNQSDVKEQAFQGLLKWSRTRGAAATTEELIVACKRPEVDRKDVADALEKGDLD